jgi:hypothetical protein
MAMYYVSDKILRNLKLVLGYKSDDDITLNTLLMEYFKIEKIIKNKQSNIGKYAYDVSHLGVGERAVFNDAYYPHGIASSIKAYSFKSGKRFNSTYIQAENRVIVERKS